MIDYHWSWKAKTVAWTIAIRAVFVLAVVLVSLIPGISTLVALIIVASLLAIVRSLQILFPANRRRRARPGRPPGDLAGDRFPRRPFPFRPAAAAERPLPGN